MPIRSLVVTVAMFANLAAPAIMSPAPARAADDGAALFSSDCAVCHQADAGGVSGQFPPLKGRVDKIAASPEGRAYLAEVVTHGLAGPIQIGADPYAGYMPPLAQLSDDQIAAVLTYVSGLGTTRPAPVIAAAEVAKARAENLMPPAVNQQRQALVAAHKL